MLLLEMDDEGRVTLEHVSEEMDEAVCRFPYPLVEKAFEDVRHQQEAGDRDTTGPHEWSPAQRELIRKAVAAERERVRRQSVAEPLTERGRDIKRQLDLPASLIRKYERRVARTVLRRTEVPKDPRKRH